MTDPYFVLETGPDGIERVKMEIEGRSSIVTIQMEGGEIIRIAAKDALVTIETGTGNVEEL